MCSRDPRGRGSGRALRAALVALVVAPTAFAQDPAGVDPPGPPAIAAPAPAPTPLPEEDPRGADGLRTDLERIITNEEEIGWFLDEGHYTTMHAPVVQSVCRATPEARRLALRRLLEESGAVGDPRALYDAASGKTTAAVEQALHLQRMRTALERAMTAPCPFWVRQQRGYDGRQTDRNQFTLNAETGGLFQLRYAAEKATIGGGPSIRVLAGYGFGNVGVLAGPEFSAGPMLREGTSQLDLNYFLGLPILVRMRSGSWVYTLETGPMTVRTHDTRASYGVRGGGGLGLMTLRSRYFIAWAGIALYYEHYFQNSVRPAAELVRGGLRIAIIFAP